MSMTPTRNLAIGTKKPLKAPCSSSSPLSKKQKVSGVFMDQPIEQLIDVTEVSGVNLREEEEQLFSGPKHDSHVSEAPQKVFQDEEESLILHKIQLRKKVVEIMAMSGLKGMSNDVMQSVSVCVEDRLRGIITNLIRLSKQRVDTEKRGHRTIITSDIRKQITAMNCKAREEWGQKQDATENSQKPNALFVMQCGSNSGVHGEKEKDESRGQKGEGQKMQMTAVNKVVRDATGVDDVALRWKQMIVAKKKHGGPDASSCSHASTSALVRKLCRSQVLVPLVARSITVKDVIAVLEREPQMSKSSLIYELYDKVKN